MSNFELELGDSNETGPCPRCGNRTKTVWGYAYDNDIALGVYYVRWTPGHTEIDALFLISIGWETEEVADRKSIALSCRLLENGPAFMVTDAQDTPWSNKELLGTMLDRPSALALPEKDQVFAIADCILERDGRVRKEWGSHLPEMPSGRASLRWLKPLFPRMSV